MDYSFTEGLRFDDPVCALLFVIGACLICLGIAAYYMGGEA